MRDDRGCTTRLLEKLRKIFTRYPEVPVAYLMVVMPGERRVL